MTARPRHPWRRADAVLAGFLSVAVLSLATDEALHLLKVYPPWGPLRAPGLNALALSYRLVDGVVGGYITAKFAPYAPIHHSVILGMAGTIASAAGAIVTVPLNLGPTWYPIALLLTALPCAALGGILYTANQPLSPYTFRSPECGDFRAPDFAAPSSLALTHPARSKSLARGS